MGYSYIRVQHKCGHEEHYRVEDDAFWWHEAVATMRMGYEICPNCKKEYEKCVRESEIEACQSRGYPPMEGKNQALVYKAERIRASAIYVIAELGHLSKLALKAGLSRKQRLMTYRAISVLNAIPLVTNANAWVESDAFRSVGELSLQIGVQLAWSNDTTDKVIAAAIKMTTRKETKEEENE